MIFKHITNMKYSGYSGIAVAFSYFFKIYVMGSNVQFLPFDKYVSVSKY